MRKQKYMLGLLTLCLGLCFFSSGKVEAIDICPADTMLCGPVISSGSNLSCEYYYFVVGNSTKAWYHNNITTAFNICIGKSKVDCFDDVLSSKIATAKIVKRNVTGEVQRYYNYKKDLLNAIKGRIILTIDTNSSYGSYNTVNRSVPIPIADLQEKVLKLSGGGIDCKFGLGTMEAFINKSFCPVYNLGYEDKILDANNNFVCPTSHQYEAIDETVSSPSYGGTSMCCTKEKPSCATIGKNDGFIIEPQVNNKCLGTQDSKKYENIICCKEREVVPPEPEVCVIGQPCGDLAIDSNATYSKESDLTITVEFYCVGSDQQVNDNFINTPICDLIKINGNLSYGRSANQNKCVLTLTSDQLKSFNEADIDVEVAIDKIDNVECEDYEGTKTIPYIGNVPAPAACTVAWTGGKCDVADPDKKREQDKSNPTCCRKACKDGESRMKNGVIDEINGKCTCDPNKTVNGKPQCCGVKLNTIVPFIGDCIEMSNTNTVDLSDPNKTTVNQLNAFPILMGGLTKILVTVILIVSFLMIVVGGALMTFGETKVGSEGGYKQGIKILGRVIAAIALLGISGIILKLINPTFFG